MSRSRTVNLVLLVSSVAALEACARRQCVDQNNIVVDDRYCQGQTTAGSFGYHSYGYRWYTSYGSGTPIGSRASSSWGTVRGIFGAAGDAAGHASGHGGGGGQ